MIRRLLQRGAASLLLLLPVYGHGGGTEPAAAECAQCHALERPEFERLGVDERLQRKAPPLFFAGNKYQRDWLVNWLQAPGTIHPAGYFPETAVINTAEGDVPAPDALHQHKALDAAKAEQIADYLMNLRPYDAMITSSSYTPGKVSMRMGQMDFRKFKGCNACHQDAEGEGGFSGPVLYNAWQRLQPAYIASFVQNPTAWDPNSAMPVPQMNEAAVHKLVNYLRAIGGEE